MNKRKITKLIFLAGIAVSTIGAAPAIISNATTMSNINTYRHEESNISLQKAVITKRVAVMNNGQVVGYANPYDMAVIQSHNGNTYNIVTEFGLIGTVNKNDLLIVQNDQNDKLVTISEQEHVIHVTTDLHLRSEASANSSIITNLKEGTNLNVIGKQGEWLKVNVNGYTGFVFGDFIQNGFVNSSNQNLQQSNQKVSSTQKIAAPITSPKGQILKPEITIVPEHTSVPTKSEVKNVIPIVQPTAQKATPVVKPVVKPESHNSTPASKPVVKPESHNSTPASKPVVKPESHNSTPASKPVVKPESHNSTPASKPVVKPESHNYTPVVKPVVKPESHNSTPASKPVVKPESHNSTPASKPVVKPESHNSTPASKPVVNKPESHNSTPASKPIVNKPESHNSTPASKPIVKPIKNTPSIAPGQIIPTYSAIVIPDTATVRSAPSTTPTYESIIGSVKKGDIVQVISRINNWYEIEFDGSIGYIRPNFVNTNGANIPTAKSISNKANTVISSANYPNTMKKYVAGEIQEYKRAYGNKLTKAQLEYASKQLSKAINPKAADTMFEFLKINEFRNINVNELNAALENMGVFKGQGQAFIDAAKKYGMDPIYLLAQSILETGHGTSNFAKGITIDSIQHVKKNKEGNIISYTTEKLSKPVTVYNFYGIGAYNSDPNYALTYAYNHGWTNPAGAIEGGAKMLHDDYLDNAIKQVTPYEIRYINGTNAQMWHQYATDIQYSQELGKLIKQYSYLYNSNDTFTFGIPKFKES